MKRMLAAAVMVFCILGGGYAIDANAVGLGELTLKSSLNEPFKAEVKLLNIGDLTKNQLLPNLASHEDFARAGVERLFFLTNLKFNVQIAADGSAVIHLSTDKIVREPFLNFLVELHWPSGRLLREYTVLLDPPVFSEAPAPSVTRTTAAPSPERKPAPRPKVAVNTPTRSSPATSSRSTPTRNTVANLKGGTVPVKKNDTLWGIAKRHRPSTDVSIRKTMLAIQKHNPQAFIRNNINLLKSGQVLRIPSVAEIREFSAAAAHQEVSRQNNEWRSADGLPNAIEATDDFAAVTPAPGPSDAGEQGQLKLVSDEPEEYADDSWADNDQNSASGTSVEEAGQVADGALGAMDVDGGGIGDLDNDSALASQGDVQALAEQVESLKRLLSLKDQQLALLQASQGKQESEGAAAALQTENTQQADYNQAANAADAEPAAARKKESGFLDTLTANPLYIGILVFVALAVLLIVGASRRRSQEDEYSGGMMAPEPAASGADGDLADFDLPEELDGDGSLDSPVMEDDEVVEAGADDSEQVAPTTARDDDSIRKMVEEADIYIAYGRYERALEMLKPAVVDNPHSAPLRLKMAEIYLATGDSSGLAQQETDLEAIGDDEALAQLEKMKAKKLGSDETAGSDAADAAASSATEEGAGTIERLEEKEERAEEAAEQEELGAIEFELPEAEPKASDIEVDDPTEEEPENPEEPVTADADDMDFLGDTDETATKLELARAYIDMADREAAEEILGEVIAEGNDSQKQEAQEMLDKLG